MSRRLARRGGFRRRRVISDPTRTYDFVGTNGAAWPSPWTKHGTNGVLDIQGNRGRLATPATQYTRCFARWNGNEDNVEVSGVVVAPDTVNSNRCEIMVRADFTNNNWYCLRPVFNFDVWHIARYDANARTVLTADVAFAFADGVATRFRFRVEGTTLYGKMWADGTAEPSAWGMQVNDATYASGDIGFNHETGVLDTSKVVEVDDVTIDPIAASTYSHKFDVADQVGWPSPWTADSGTLSIVTNKGRAVSPTTQWTWGRARYNTSWENAEITGTFFPKSLTGEHYIAARLRHKLPDATSYSIELRPDTGEWFVKRLVQGQLQTFLGQGTHAYTVDVGVKFRLRVEGSVIRAKVWAAANAEPATWMVDTTDIGVTGSGDVTVGVITGVAGVSHSADVDDLTLTQLPAAAGTAGELYLEDKFDLEKTGGANFKPPWDQFISSEGAGANNTPRIMTDATQTRHPGGRSLRLHVTESDMSLTEDANLKKVRAQLMKTNYIDWGQERYFGLSVMLPNLPLISNGAAGSDGNVGGWFIFFTPGNPGGSSSGKLRISTISGFNYIEYASGNDYGAQAVWRSQRLELEHSVWIDFVFRIKFSQDPTIGFIEIWKNGATQPLRSIGGNSLLAPNAAAETDRRLYYSTIDKDATLTASSVLDTNISHYRKQGMSGWSAHSIWHDQHRVGSTYDVVNPATP